MDLIKTTQQILCHPEKMHKMPVILQKVHSSDLFAEIFFFRILLRRMKSRGNAKVKGALRVGTRRGVYIVQCTYSYRLKVRKKRQYIYH